MEFLDSRYGKGAAGYDQRIRNLFPFYDTIHGAINAALRALIPAEGELLIVGAGTGAEIVELGKTNPGWHFVGVDPAQSMLDIARRKLEAAGLSERAALVRGYIADLPDETVYDGATAAMVCHFLPDDGGKQKLLNEIASHLKSGAPLVLMDMHGDLSVAQTNLLVEAWKHQQNLAGVSWPEVENRMKERVSAVHFVSAQRIETLLARAGFRDIQQFFKVFVLGGWIAFK